MSTTADLSGQVAIISGASSGIACLPSGYS